MGRQEDQCQQLSCHSRTELRPWTKAKGEPPSPATMWDRTQKPWPQGTVGLEYSKAWLESKRPVYAAGTCCHS